MRSAAAHAFVADLDAPKLAEDDWSHLARSLRIRPGEEITVSDGVGGWRRCRFGDELECVGDVERVARPAPTISVAISLTKGERLDWAVQKLTELDIDVVVPMVADRSVVRWEGDRAAHHVERLRRIARQAAMQSRRVWLPAVEDLQPFAALAGRPGATIAEPGGEPPSLERPLILVGPEGGWSDGERDRALPEVGLGPQILRVETAAVAAATVMAALRAGLVRPG